MTESLWNAVDDHVAAALLENLGEAGAYTDLVVQSVHILATTDPSEWAGIVTPFQIIMSYQSRASSAGHAGDGTFPRAMEYIMTILSVVDGTPEESARNAKTLAWRTEKMLATLRFGVTTDDGSKATRPKGGSSETMYATQIESFPKQSNAKANIKYGVGVTSFSVPGVAL